MVSGDYCDLFETDGGLLFMLGDVSGKGYCCVDADEPLHATFRSLAEGGLPLDRLVEGANRIFARALRGTIRDDRRGTSGARWFSGVCQRGPPSRASRPWG